VDNERKLDKLRCINREKDSPCSKEENNNECCIWDRYTEQTASDIYKQNTL
jgi:hypothetical protein